MAAATRPTGGTSSSSILPVNEQSSLTDTKTASAAQPAIAAQAAQKPTPSKQRRQEARAAEQATAASAGARATVERMHPPSLATAPCVKRYGKQDLFIQGQRKGLEGALALMKQIKAGQGASSQTPFEQILAFLAFNRWQTAHEQQSEEASHFGLRRNPKVIQNLPGPPVELVGYAIRTPLQYLTAPDDSGKSLTADQLVPAVPGPYAEYGARCVRDIRKLLVRMLDGKELRQPYQEFKKDFFFQCDKGGPRTSATVEILTYEACAAGKVACAPPCVQARLPEIQQIMIAGMKQKLTAQGKETEIPAMEQAIVTSPEIHHNIDWMEILYHDRPELYEALVLCVNAMLEQEAHFPHIRTHQLPVQMGDKVVMIQRYNKTDRVIVTLKTEVGEGDAKKFLPTLQWFTWLCRDFVHHPLERMKYDSGVTVQHMNPYLLPEMEQELSRLFDRVISWTQQDGIEDLVTRIAHFRYCYGHATPCARGDGAIGETFDDFFYHYHGIRVTRNPNPKENKIEKGLPPFEMLTSFSFPQYRERYRATLGF